VVVEPDEVVGPVVVGAVPVVVEADVAPVPVEEVSVAEEVDVVSLEVELEKVLPIVIGETSPSAPETSKPSAKSAATATATRI
jgi:hypothetical protein